MTCTVIPISLINEQIREIETTLGYIHDHQVVTEIIGVGNFIGVLFPKVLHRDFYNWCENHFSTSRQPPIFDTSTFTAIGVALMSHHQKKRQLENFEYISSGATDDENSKIQPLPVIIPERNRSNDISLASLSEIVTPVSESKIDFRYKKINGLKTKVKLFSKKSTRRYNQNRKHCRAKSRTILCNNYSPHKIGPIINRCEKSKNMNNAHTTFKDLVEPEMNRTSGNNLPVTDPLFENRRPLNIDELTVFENEGQFDDLFDEFEFDLFGDFTTKYENSILKTRKRLDIKISNKYEIIAWFY